MMKSLAKVFLTILFVAFLCFAISETEDEAWLTVWFVLFFFVGIPLALVVLRDVLVVALPRWVGPSQMLLHICAVFGAVIGYGLGVMAVSSGHEKAHLHQLMVIVFPVLVYAAPLLMVFNGVPLSRVKEFYFRSKNDGR
ncbi:hypothetical protein [Alcanivorax jadensis]|uniref:hypothetical protein n=1 Tax=Alcanivorax jadensis TaxID=64988 RepID=UPI0026EC8574|nr:hypothetical protein [Alcanivorax jadensis]MCK5887643.1 hypothetical protein [Alcanivorax sp.]